MDFLPDLATRTPLWLALTTVAVNAVAGLVVAVVVVVVVDALGVRTRRATDASAFIFTRATRREDGKVKPS